MIRKHLYLTIILVICISVVFSFFVKRVDHKIANLLVNVDAGSSEDKLIKSTSDLSQAQIGKSHSVVAPSRVDLAPLEPLYMALAVGSDDAWLNNYERIMGLSAIELWELLVRPEIKEQPQASQLMDRLLSSCSIALAELDLKLPETQLTSQPMNRDWCQSLLFLKSEGMIAQALSDHADKDLASLRARLPPVGLMDTDEEKKKLVQRSQQVLDASNDPYLVRRAVDNVLQSGSDVAIPDLKAWYGLPKSQRSYVNQAAQAMASCEAVHACGPSSLVLADYCALVPGLNCVRGMGMQQVVQNSLSANQLQVFNGIMSGIRQRRSAPQGP
jgi:hypothetical protein